MLSTSSQDILKNQALDHVLHAIVDHAVIISHL